jgi:hypothetical protein
MRALQVTVLLAMMPLCAHGASSCDDVPTRIQTMRDADQAVRLIADQTQWKPVDAERLHAIDTTNTKLLKQIVAHCGWPTISRYGEATARRAWLIAQHADFDPAFQRRVLGWMTPLVSRGDANGQDLAYLSDRVRIAAGQPQLYGTQFTSDADGTLRLLPHDDLRKINARRRAIGLDDVDSYLAFARKQLDEWQQARPKSPSNAEDGVNPATASSAAN